jgi:ring-1,2-phenylacetyl-CoA epoxidase subunit PaaD
VSLQDAPPRSARQARAWEVLATVLDPEVPVLSVVDLGIVRDVVEQGAELEVVLTPTYSGCPATEVIDADVRAALEQAGLGPVHTRLQRSPAWTTDWMGENARSRLRAYGIAPPGKCPVVGVGTGTGSSAGLGSALGDNTGKGAIAARPIGITSLRTPAIPCPRCSSTATERLSAFGATACKALYRCTRCREPFEHFKPI